MSKNKLLDWSAFVCDALIAISECVGFKIALDNHGLGIFIFYTQLSNLFLLVATMIYLYFLGRRMFGGKHEIPRGVEILKYSATICVCLTFLVSASLLSWMTEYNLQRILTEGAMLYHHTLCPLLAVGCFIFLEKYNIRRGGEIVAGIVPTILYAIVAIALNIAKIWHGPYPFLMVYRQPIYASVIWCTAILGATYSIAIMLRAADRAMRKPKPKARIKKA